MLTVARPADSSVVPRQPFLDWLESLNLVDIDVSLADLADPSLSACSECSDEEEMASLLAGYCSQTFSLNNCTGGTGFQPFGRPTRAFRGSASGLIFGSR